MLLRDEPPNVFTKAEIRAMDPYSQVVIFGGTPLYGRPFKNIGHMFLKLSIQHCETECVFFF